MGKVWVTVAAFFLLLGLNAYALEISVGVNYSDLDLSGKVKSDGTEIDLEDDLGIGDDEPTGLSLRLDGGRHHLWFNFASIEFSGSKIINRQFTFRNKTYAVSSLVDSKLEYDLYQLQYHYDLINIGEIFELSPLFKVSLYDAEVRIKSSTYDESYKETLPLPTLGLLGRLNLSEYIDFYAQVSGIGYSGDTYIEYKTAVILRPIQYSNLEIGYKAMDVDYSDDDNLIDIKNSGFFALVNFTYAF